jgi:hypothetical protein
MQEDVDEGDDNRKQKCDLGNGKNKRQL